MTKELNLLRNWQAETWSKFGLDFPIILSSLESSFKVINEHLEDNSTLWRTITVSHRKDSVVDVSLQDTIIESESLPFDVSLNSRLRTLVNNIKSQTSKTDFLQELRYSSFLFSFSLFPFI